MEANNITQIDLSWTDPYSILEENPWLKACVGTLLVGALVVGTPLLLGITLFERFGGDPQKRGVLNQVRKLSIDKYLSKYLVA